MLLYGGPKMGNMIVFWPVDNFHLGFTSIDTG